MREDMSRVIVERPRIIDGIGRKGRAVPLEALPKQQGMRRFHRERGSYQILNENLAPLRRYLEKQVGRPWDKVFAEIAARLRVDSTVQQHVRDHVKDFVAITPRRRTYTVRLRDGSRAWRETLWHQPLYVDPADGILKRTDRLPEAKAQRRREAARKQRQTPATRIALAPDRELRRIGGIWYEIALAALPEPEYRAETERRDLPLKRYGHRRPTIAIELVVRRLVTPPVRDAVTAAMIPAGPAVDEASAWRDYRRRYPDRRYATGKRQLSARALRRYGLTNAAGAKD